MAISDCFSLPRSCCCLVACLATTFERFLLGEGGIFFSSRNSAHAKKNLKRQNKWKGVKRPKKCILYSTLVVSNQQPRPAAADWFNIQLIFFHKIASPELMISSSEQEVEEQGSRPIMWGTLGVDERQINRSELDAPATASSLESASRQKKRY